MPEPFVEQLIAQVGPVDGYVHVESQHLLTPTAVAANDMIGLITTCKPWKVGKTKTIVDLHPVAVWRNLSVTLQPLGGVYGRMVTFYGGWANHGAPEPTTISDMRRLKCKMYRVFGGTGDPGVTPYTVNVDFDGTMSSCMKMPYNEGIRAVFYFCFTETDVVDGLKDHPRFSLEFNGHFDVYGRY